MPHKFSEGQIVVINTNEKDIKHLNGTRAEIIDSIPEYASNDYVIKYQNQNGKEIAIKVKENELQEIDDEILLTLDIGQKVIYEPLNLIVEVNQIDFVYKQVSILFEDNGSQVVGIEKLRLIENDTRFPIKIALIGKMRSGKDTLAEFLIENYGFKRFAFGDELKRYFHELFGDSESKPREGYQWFGQTMRERDPDIWVRKCFETISESKSKKVIITDLRQPNEYQKCRDEGFILIKVHSDDEIRLKRILEKNDSFNKEDLFHETEMHIDKFDCDYIIRNVGSLEDLYKQIEDIMRKISN